MRKPALLGLLLVVSCGQPTSPIPTRLWLASTETGELLLQDSGPPHVF